MGLTARCPFLTALCPSVEGFRESYTREKEGHAVTVVDDLMRMTPMKKENSGETFLWGRWWLRHQASNKTKSKVRNWEVRLKDGKGPYYQTITFVSKS